MQLLFKKQVYIRLSEDGASFLYTIKYGHFAALKREVRLIQERETPVLPEMSDSPIPSHVPLPARITRKEKRR